MITTSHRWDDTRIFWLESCNLRRLGVEVTVLAVNCDSDDSERNGVRIVALGRNRGRLGRFMLNPLDAVRYCKLHSSDYDALHVHDPELLPWIGRLRKVTGRPVIYDMHEFLPDIVSVRSWIPPCLRRLSIAIAHTMECRGIGNASAAVVINELGEIRARQLGMNEVAIFMGVPSRDEAETSTPYDSSRTGVAYVGGVAMARGADTIAEVAPRILALHGCRVLVAGPLRDETARTTVKRDGIDYRGILTRPEVRLILNEAAVGWLPLHHTPNHEKGWALKLGEYMAAGLPVVVSDLAYCASMVNRYDCGIVVDADDADAHLNALDYLLSSPDEAKRLGTNGKRAILEELNAEAYALELRELYGRLLPGTAVR